MSQRATTRLTVRQQLTPTAEAGVWQSTGDDPQFQLETPPGRTLGPGWIRITAQGQALDGTFRPQLFWDDGTGYAEARSLRVAVGHDGRMEATLVLPSRATAWRFDPMDSIGSFRLDWVRLESLSQLAIGWSVVGRSLQKARRHPSHAVRLLRQAGALALVGGPSAIGRVVRAAALGQGRMGLSLLIEDERVRVQNSAGFGPSPTRRPSLASRSGSPAYGSQQTIAIGLIEHFGDIVACEPVARHLRAAFPDAHLAWVVRSRYRELIDTNPHIDETIEVECLTDWIKLVRHGAFDSVVDLHVNHRVCSQCDVPLVKQHGDTSVTVETYYDHGNLLAAFCKGAGLTALTDGPQIYIPPATVATVDSLNLPARFVAVNCRSNESSRDWPARHWRSLIDRLRQERQIDVVEVGLEPVIGQATGVTDATGRLSLLETAEVIRRASLFIGIDSGPAHLANAAGTPGVVLLGKYRRFDKYLPFSGGYADGSTATMVYNEHGPASELAVEDVVKAALARLDVARARSTEPSRPQPRTEPNRSLALSRNGSGRILQIDRLAAQASADSRDALTLAHWSHHPRYRFLKSTPFGGKLLDVGAAQGVLSHWRGWGLPVRTDIELHGLDIDASAAYISAYASHQVMNLERDRIDHPDETFDAVLVSHVVEHLQDPSNAVQEIARVLKKGGRVYVETPSRASEGCISLRDLAAHGIVSSTFNFFDDATHIRPYAPDELLERLAQGSLTAVDSGIVEPLEPLTTRLLAAGIRDRDYELTTYGLWRFVGWASHATAEKPGGVNSTALPISPYQPTLALDSAGGPGGRPLVDRSIRAAPWDLETTQLSGWAVDPLTNAPGDALFVRIGSSILIKAVYGFDRPDVAASLGEQGLKSGFYAFVPPTLVPGRHEVSIELVAAGSGVVHAARRWLELRV